MRFDGIEVPEALVDFRLYICLSFLLPGDNFFPALGKLEQSAGLVGNLPEQK